MEKLKNDLGETVVIPFKPNGADAAKAPPPASRGRKKAARAKNVEARVDAPVIDYDQLGIAPEDVALFEEVRAFFISLGRKKTEEVFECGAVLSKVEEKAPDQKTFETWTRKACGITRRGAWNYLNVHRKLARHRDRFTAQSVAASAMYKLSGADDATVESVLASFEAGARMTVTQINALLKGDDAQSRQATTEQGGIAGLKAKIAEKTNVGAPALMDTAAQVLETILVALEPHRRGKRVEKGTLQKQLVHPARLLRQQLEWLTWMAVPEGPFAQVVAHGQPLTRDDRWHTLWYTMGKLGDYEGWPESGKLGAWLADTVAAELEWLLGEKAEKAYAAAARVTKEAEARTGKGAKASHKAPARASRRKGAEKTAAARPDKANPVESDVGTARSAASKR